MIIIGTFLSNVLALWTGRILCMIAQTSLLHYKYINNSANLKVWNIEMCERAATKCEGAWQSEWVALVVLWC